MGTLSVVAKAAVAKKDTVVRQVAKSLTAMGKSFQTAVEEVADKVADPIAETIVQGAKNVGSWLYDNVIKPVTSPSSVPRTQYRGVYCGAVA
jgi:hypothetical protein